MTMKGSDYISHWPEESREAAQLVIDQYGEPDEATESQLTWHHPGSWKRIVASKAFYRHNFPVPHFDSVESVIDYKVPVGKFTPLAEFDGSIVAERTAGEASARCHDEQANALALNLMHDIVTGAKTVAQARVYYAKEFINYRRRQPTPYMDKLRFTSEDPAAADPDVTILTEKDITEAIKEGRAKSGQPTHVKAREQWCG